MTRSSNLKRAIVFVALLALLLVVLAGCVKTASTDEFNQFVPPSSDVTDAGKEPQGTKVAISGETAIKTLFDSFINAQASGTTAANMLNFSFAPYFSITKDGKNVTYTIDVKGSINKDDNDKSVFSFEVIKAQDGAAPIIILGIYGNNGNIIVDSRNYETGDLVNQYYVDDMDISFIATTLQRVLDQLDAGGFIEKFSVKDMLQSTGLADKLSSLPIDLNAFLSLDGTLLDLIFSLVEKNSSDRPEDMCYMTDVGGGVTQLIMPLSLNGILENIGMVGPVINNALAGQSSIVKTIINLLFGDILSGRTTMKLYIRADIKDNMFQKAAISVVTEGTATHEYEVGVGEVSASKDSTFKNNIIAEMPEVAKGERMDYSFTTLSLDLGITLDLAQHTYSLGAIDSAIGGAIGGLLGAVDGNIWKQKEIVIGEGGLTINLQLKVRAELNLKDNSKTRVSLEIFGSADEKLRIGAYYKGADEALYIDMSGMGGGKIKVSKYYAYVLESERGSEVSYDNKSYTLNDDGTYSVKDNGKYIKVQRGLNLNKIIAAALDKYVPQIPSILDLVNGKLGIASAAEGEDENVLGIATLSEIADWLRSGDLVVPHYGFNADKAALSAADEGGSVDVLGLITSILSCAVIKKGDATISLDGLYVYMTKDVIDSIFRDALGLNLPIDTLNLKLEQIKDKNDPHYEGWLLDVSLSLAKENEELVKVKLADANVYLYLNYGNPDPTFQTYFDNLPLYGIDETHADGFLDTDWLATGDLGELNNINLNLALETRFKFSMAEGAEFDFSPLGQLLANLALKLQAENNESDTDDVVDVDLGIKIAANVNIATLISVIQKKTDAAALLNAIEARIDIGKYGEDYSIMLYFNKGVLYIDAPRWGAPKYKLDLTDIIAGNFKLFGKDTSQAVAAEDALAAYMQDPEAKDDTDILAVVFGMIGGIEVDNSALSLALTDKLFSLLFNMLGIEWGEVEEITSEGTNVTIKYDGLNLSKLWLEVNIGMQQGEGNTLNTSLGLGGIAIGVGNANLTSDLDFTGYRDIMNGGNIFLGLQAEIDIYLKQNEISLDNMLGALIADANSALGTTIDINDTINGGILLSLMVDLDITSNSASNDSMILIELRRRSDYSLMLGLYYKHDGVNGGKLYLDTTGTLFQPVALDIDLISLIGGLIGGGSGSALAADDGSAAALDLGGLDPVILLGNRGVQIKVLQGITDIIFDLLVGDFNDYIDYEASKKFFLLNADTSAEVLAAADKVEGEIVKYQKTFDKYVRIAENEFVAYDETNDAHKELTIYAKATDKNYFYLKVSDPTDPTYALDADILNNAISDGNGGYKIFVMKSSGGDYTEVTKDNNGQYSEDIGNATLYAQFKYIPATMLVKSDEAKIAGYGAEGFVPQYNFIAGVGTSPIASYVAIPATAEDLYLYQIYEGNVANRPGTEQAMQLKIPELGAVVHIGKIVRDGNSTVSVIGGDDFGGIGIGIFIWPFGIADADRTPANASGNLAIKIGNIMLSDAKFKAASYNENNYGLADFIDNVVATRVTNTASATDLNDLTVYLNVEAAIDLSAMKNKDGTTPYEWEVGGLLSAVLGGSMADKPELLAIISALLLKLNIPEDINTVIGLRIAGNVKLGRLLNSKASDTLGKVLDMLVGSEVAVEIYNDYVHADGAKMIVGLYIEDGWLYVHADGSLVPNTKFKIELANVVSLIGSLGGTSEANAAAEDEGMSLVSILGLISGAVDSIEINNSVTNKSLKINLGAQLLTAIVGLIAGGIEGVKLPELTPENSFIELNTTRRIQPGEAGYDAKKDYILKLSLGIEPTVIAIVLGGLEIGLSDDPDVIPGDRPLSEDVDYKTIDQLADNVSLNLELGVKLKLNQGVLPAGYIVSTIMQELGYDIEFPLDMDLQDDIALDLAIQLQANLNLNNLEQSEIKLAIVNNARTENKTVLGMYFAHEKNAQNKEIPVLFVETNFSSQGGAANKWKIYDFNLLDSLLGDMLTSLVGVLSSEVSSTSALAAEEVAAPTAAEILLSLQENSIKLKISEELILTLLNILVKDGVSTELYEIIDSLNAAAEVAITTGGDKGVGITVDVTTTYLDLGVAILNPQLSLGKYEDIFTDLNLSDASWSQAGIGSYVDGTSALSLELGLQIDYDLSNGVYSLDKLIADIAGGDFMKGSDTLVSLSGLLKNLTLDLICQNTRGYIGVDIVINMLSAEMNSLLPAVGVYLKNLVMGKIDPNYVVTDEEGNTFNAMSLLGMVEAGIFIDLNGKQIVISLAQDENEKGELETYVYITLEHFGGDNIKMSLTKVIESIQSVSGGASSALAAEDTAAKETDYALIGKIIGNAISSITASKVNGLDIALAPTFLQVILADVVAGLLGDTFKFSPETLDMFKLTSPFVKMGEIGKKVTVDDVEYLLITEERYVKRNTESKTQDAYMADMKEAGNTDYAQLYYKDTHAYDAYVGNIATRYLIAAGTKLAASKLVTDDGKVYVYKEVVSGEGSVYVEYNKTVDGVGAQTYVKFDGEYMAVTSGKVTFATEKYIETTQIVRDDLKLYVNTSETATPAYVVFDATTHDADAQLYVLSGNVYIATKYFATKYVRYAAGSPYHVEFGEISADNANYYVNTAEENATPAYAVYDAATHGADAQLYVKSEGAYLPVSTAAKAFVRYSYEKYISAGNVTDDTARYMYDENTSSYVLDATNTAAQQFVKVGENYLPVYRKVVHSGITWKAEEGLGIALIFADQNGTPGFSLKLGLDANLAIKGMAQPVFPELSKPFTTLDTVAENGMLYISLVVSIDLSGKESSNDLDALLSQLIADSTEEGGFQFSKIAALGILLDIAEFNKRFDIRITLAASMVDLVSAITAETFDIVSLLQTVELAIEPLYTEDDDKPAGKKVGEAMGGLYLYKGNLYIDYINDERGIFAMNISELFALIGADTKAASAMAAGEGDLSTSAAMLQLWIGEYVSFGGIMGTGVAIRITTTVVEGLLSALLNKPVSFADNLKTLEAEITINTGEPVAGVDNAIYAKIVKQKTEDGVYEDIVLDEGEDYTFMNVADPNYDPQTAEGYNAKYPELVARYVKDANGNYNVQKYQFSLDSFAIGIGLRVATLNVGITLGQFDVGLAYDGTEDQYEVVPDSVKNNVEVPEDMVLDLGLNIEVGLIMSEANGKFDIGAFIDGLELLGETKLGSGWLLVSVPDVRQDGAPGSAEIRLILEVALELNLTNIDKSVARIRIIGQSYDPAGLMGETVLGVLYFKDGELLVDLDGLGFGRIKLTGLVLSNLLGTNSGIELIKGLLSSDTATTSSSALAAEDPAPAVIEIGQTGISAIIGEVFFAGLFDALIPLKYEAADDGKYVLIGEDYVLFDENNPDHAGLTRYNNNETTRKLLSSLGLNAKLNINSFKYQFVEDENGKYVYNAGQYEVYDAENKAHADKTRYTYTSSFSIKLEASVSQLIKVTVAIDKIKIGNTHVGEAVAAIDASNYIEAARINFSKDDAGKTKVDLDVMLETVSLNLQLDIAAQFTDGMFVGDQVAVGSVGDDLVGLTAYIKADIEMAALMGLIGGGIDTNNIPALISDILPMVRAQISIVRADDKAHEIIGIYIVDGDVVLKLDGMGMPNIRVTNDFLLEVIGALATSSSALAAEGEATTEETTLDKILGALPSMLQGVFLVEKSVRIALNNDYFVTLLDMILFPGSSYYQDVMPDPSPNYPATVGNASFSGIIINFKDLFDNKELGIERQGLLQIDLDMYSTHLNVDLFMPLIKFNDTENRIALPNGFVAQKTVDRDDTSIDLSLSLAGQLKIDKNEGVALANVLGSVVGDLETKLVIQDDIDLRFRISASASLAFSLAEKTFNIAALDLMISFARMVDGKEVPLAAIYYTSADGALYLDLSYFFKGQENAATRNLGKLKVTGIDVLGLLGGLLSGGSSVSEALAAAGDTNAWVPETNNTVIHTPATAANIVAPQKYVLVSVKETPEGGTVAVDKYAYNRLESKYATSIFVMVGDTPVVYDANEGAHAGLQGYANVNGVQKALYVKDGSNYLPYVCSNAAMQNKARYTKDLVTEFVEYNPAVHTGTPVTYVKVYNPTTYTYSYVPSTDASYAAHAAAPTIYVSNGEGGYTTYTGNDTRYVIDYVLFDQNNTAHKTLTKYAQKVAEDGAIYYVKDANGTYVKDYVEYSATNANHAKKGLYILVDGAYTQLYIQSPIYGLSAVWAVVAEGSNTASVYITGKALLGLIGKAANNKNLSDILDTLLITINASREPFVFGADISILDIYNGFVPAVSLHLNIFGFDHTDGKGSTLSFTYNELKPADSENYRTLVDVDLNKIMNAAEIKDVLLEALKFGGKDTEDGKLYLNASISLDTLVNETGLEPKNWAPFIANILGLTESEVDVWLDVFYGEDVEADWGFFTIELAAAIDAGNLIGGLLDGSGLNLSGTEIQLTLCMDSPHLAESIRGKKIYITVIGEDTDGQTGIYIDLHEYRGKGKHKLSLNLASLIGDSLGSAASEALAAADVNYGLLPANVFNILNAIIGEVRLADGKISVGLKDTFLGDILNTFAGLNIDKTQSLVTGEVFIDVRNLGLGANLYVGNVALNSDDEKEADIGIKLNIGKINLKPNDALLANGTFISEEERRDYTNILDLVLDIDMEIEWKYESAATSETNPPVELKSLIDLIGTLIGKPLFDNPSILLKADAGGIDATYTIKLNAHLDLGQMLGRKTMAKDGLQIVLELWRKRSDEAQSYKRLGVYVDSEDIYIDLSPIGLPKLSVDNVNLGTIIKDALSGLAGTLGGTSEGGSALAAADIADEAFREKWGTHLLSSVTTPYFSLIFRPNAFALGLNSELINALLETLSGALGMNIVLPDIGDIAIIVDSSSGNMRPSLIARISPEFYFSLALTDLHINGNLNYVPSWQTAAKRFATNVEGQEDKYTPVYDVAAGTVGLERVNLGLDLTIRQDGFNSTPADAEYGNSFEFYLWALLSGLLGNEDLSVAFNLGTGNDVIGYDVRLRASVNIAMIVSALSGSGDDWWSDVELYLTMKPNNTTTFLGGSYGTLISAYKMKGDADVYIDLNGLSLPKIKIVGLGGLIGGLVGSVSSALAAEATETTEATAAEDTQAKLTITFKQNGLRIDLGMGIIEGILNLLGDTLTIEKQNYSHAFKYNGQTYTRSKELMVINTGTLQIPIPVLSADHAVSLELTYPDINKGTGISLGLDIGLGLDKFGNNVKLAIDNFVLSTDEEYYDKDVNGNVTGSKFVKYGSVNGKINKTGTNIFDAVSEEEAHSFTGLILNDAYGVSVYNILATVLGGIDPNIGITWSKNTKYNWYQTDDVSKVEGTDSSHLWQKYRNTTIVLSRTNKDSKNYRGDAVYAGKVEAKINFTAVNRQINVWLFDNKIYGDISGLLRGFASLIETLGYAEFKIADLNILDLVGGLVGSTSEATTSTALAAEEATTAAEEGGTDILGIIKGIIKGIEINWWYNVTDVTKPEGNPDLSSIRININPQGLNELLAKVYYLVYTLYDKNAPYTTDEFATFDYEAQFKIVNNTRGTFTYNGTQYTSVNAYNMCVWYLQVFLKDLLGNMVGSILGDALRPGSLLVVPGNIGYTRDILMEILSSLLPIPWLGAPDANGVVTAPDKPSYIEIVLDKSRIDTSGVIREIGVYLNKEKVTLNGKGNNPTRNTLTDGNIGTYPESTEIVIEMLGKLNMNAVSDVRAYQVGTANWEQEATVPEDATATVINVNNPFDPVELSAASLKDNGSLLKVVDAKYYGNKDYTSKSANGKGDKSDEKDNAILGGTKIIWDTSTVSLVPGAESEMWGYALNYPVQKVKVKVNDITDFSRMYGYFNSKNEFVSASRIVVDPTLDPDRTVLAGETATVAQLPTIIVILRKDGELQILDADYDKEVVKEVVVDNTVYKTNGKFGWIEPKAADIKNGGTMAVKFWYQVGASSRIQKSVTVTYNNSSIVSGILPEGDNFAILGGGNAGDLIASNIDILGNFGINGLNVAAGSVAKAEGTTYFSAKLVDGTTVKFTKTDDNTEHVVGLAGTFQRFNGDKLLQSGTYAYVEASAVESSGLLDSLGGLLGGGDTTATDKGVYTLTVTDAGYENVSRINVKLFNGNISTVDVLGWDFSELEYDMAHPEKGVKGVVKATLNNFEYKLDAATAERSVVNSKQVVEIAVNVARYELSGITAGPDSKKTVNIAFNQYRDLFVEDDDGAYVKSSYTSTVDKDADGNFITYNGFVKYDATKHEATVQRYSQNFLTEKEVYVRVMYSALGSDVYEFDKNDFFYFTNEFTDGDSAVRMFVVDTMKSSTEKKITVTASYLNYDENGPEEKMGYEQTFNFTIVVSQKVATKAIVLVNSQTDVNSLVAAINAKGTATIIFSDNTTMADVAIKDILVKDENGLDVIGYEGAGATGVYSTTATVFRADASTETGEMAGFTQNNVKLEIRVY